MTTAYNQYIHQLLEPGDVIRTGNQKQHKPIKPAITVSQTDAAELVRIYRMKFDNEYQRQDAERQDEWLAKHGII